MSMSSSSCTDIPDIHLCTLINSIFTFVVEASHLQDGRCRMEFNIYDADGLTTIPITLWGERNR